MFSSETGEAIIFASRAFRGFLLDQGAQGKVDRFGIREVDSDVRVQHDGAVFFGEILDGYGAVFVVDGDGVALSIGFVVLASDAVGEVVFFAHFQIVFLFEIFFQTHPKSNAIFRDKTSCPVAGE